MKTLIMGRAGCGRAGILKSMADAGLRVARSYTNRQKRYDGEDTHLFMSDDEVRNIPDDAKLCRTVVNGKEFFYSRHDIEAADVISVNPEGMAEVAQLFPDEIFHVAYIRVEDDMARKLFAVRSAGDKLAEERLFDERDMAEDEAFTKFEQDYAELEANGPKPGMYPDNVVDVSQIMTEYDETCVANYGVYAMHQHKRRWRMTGLVKEAMSIGIIDEENGLATIIMDRTDEDEGTKRLVTPERFAETLLNDSEGMARFMYAFLAESKRFEDLD